MLSLASPLSPAFPHDFLGDSEYRRERSPYSTPRSVGGFTNVGFPIYDAHGNMVATLARSGSTFTLNNKRSFDAWGQIRNGAQTGDPKNRYCGSLGHQQDDESGLIYMRARYYEPGSGRFISEDPSLAGSNFFSYCSQNPVNLTDSSGNDEQADKDRARILAERMMATALLLLGLAFLGIIVSARVESLSAFAGAQSVWADIAKIQLGAKDMSIMESLIDEAKTFIGSNKGSAGGAVLAIIGLNCVYKSLLMDIDLAPDGPGALETVYG